MGIAKVIVVVESNALAAAAGGVVLVPETLLPRADDEMSSQGVFSPGALLSFVEIHGSETKIIGERSDSWVDEFCAELAEGRRWYNFHGSTDLARYHTLVVLDELLPTPGDDRLRARIARRIEDSYGDLSDADKKHLADVTFKDVRAIQQGDDTTVESDPGRIDPAAFPDDDAELRAFLETEIWRDPEHKDKSDWYKKQLVETVFTAIKKAKQGDDQYLDRQIKNLHRASKKSDPTLYVVLLALLLAVVLISWFFLRG